MTPLLVVIVLGSKTTSKVRSKLNQGIRKAIIKTSQEIYDPLILDGGKNLLSFVGEERNKERGSVHIRLFMFKRASSFDKKYLEAIRQRCENLGFPDHDVKFLPATEWTGFVR